MDTYMTPCRPTGTTGEMIVSFIRMALVAQSTRESVEQLGIMGSVGTMTIHTVLSGGASSGVVLESEWTGHLSVAGDARLAGGAYARLRRAAFGGLPRGVHLVATAADHPPFGYGMVEVVAELVDFRPVALPTHRRFVGPQQFARRGGGNEDRRFQLFVGFTGILRGVFLAGAVVNGVAADAAHVCARMLGSMPLGHGHRICVTAHTGLRPDGGLRFGISNDEVRDFVDILQIRHVNPARPMAGFTALFIGR
jgi:hypothetical protein